jgi:F-type H+-transporting ATPase subunit a
VSDVPAVDVSAVVAAEEPPFPPGVEDFFLPSIAFGPWITKFTLLIWLSVALIILFYLVAYRKPKLVPTRTQWLAESSYGFVRDGVAKEIIGHEGLRFAPYLATLFMFILVSNLFGIIPFIQISPNSHIAFPVVLAIISWVLFIYLGIRKHGLWPYLKMNLFPPAPWPLYFLLTPIEFVSTFLVRPVTLSVRLFANMFAGHLILLVFTLGGFVLLGTGNILLAAAGVVSFGMAIVMTLFEAVVAILQAYVFVVLTASYVEGALAEEH